MSKPAVTRGEIEAALDRIVAAGWAEAWRREPDDRWAVAWNDTGRQRIRWMKTIWAELDDPTMLSIQVAMATCCAIEPDEG